MKVIHIIFYLFLSQMKPSWTMQGSHPLTWSQVGEFVMDYIEHSTFKFTCIAESFPLDSFEESMSTAIYDCVGLKKLKLMYFLYTLVCL